MGINFGQKKSLEKFELSKTIKITLTFVLITAITVFAAYFIHNQIENKQKNAYLNQVLKEYGYK